MNFRLSQIPALWRSVFLSRPHRWSATRGSEPQLNKLADANWRPQSEAPEVMTVPGPIAARFAPFCASGSAVAAGFLFFLIKLRTVSDGCAPLLIQYSTRSIFNVLL